MTMEEKKWFADAVCRRFCRYVQVHTTSDPAAETRPSTPGQLVLARMLQEECAVLGVQDVALVNERYLLVRIPSRSSRPLPTICLMAHLDTSSDVSGQGVVPVLHENYNGQRIILKGGITLDPAEFPDLSRYKGDTIITAEGTTLLGADDKAGVAEIMSALEYLCVHPQVEHPGLEILFSTDEETGRGMEGFPLGELESTFCYTLDGGEEGVIEIETFEAYRVEVLLQGKSIHLGKAYGKLINALELLQTFLAMLPGKEKPETTFDREGYYCPLEVSGGIETCRLSLLIRDFDEAECRRRLGVLQQIASTLEAAFPGSRVQVETKFQYANMKKYIPAESSGLKYLEEAIRQTGLKPRYSHIRGGTDGAWLSAQGVPTPNVFTGGQNYHSRYEWIPLSAMSRAAQTIVHLVQLWAGGE